MARVSKTGLYASLCRALSAVILAAACNSEGGAGPDPLRPQYYRLILANNQSLPVVVIRGLGGDYTAMDTAVFVPFAVGRTIDQRLINDRTGRGPSGGSTRDTTVARGQFMDIKRLRHVDGPTGEFTRDRDSTLVDVEVRDTVVIIKRPHPGALQQVDTGYFADGNLLVVPTTIRFLVGQALQVPLPIVLTYRIER